MAAEMKNWFDPNTYVEMMQNSDVTKMFDSAQMPNVDTAAITEAQKKNVQAFVDANRVAAEGYQALFKKQVEVMQASIAEMTDALKDAAAEPLSHGNGQGAVRKGRCDLHRPQRNRAQGQ